MADEITLYVGAHKIASSDQDAKTGMVKYKLEGSERIWMCTLDQFKAIADTKPYPDGDMRERKLKTLVKSLLEVLLEHNVQYEDLGYILNTVKMSLESNYDKAVAKLFGRQHPDHIDLKQIDEVLKKDLTNKNEGE